VYGLRPIAWPALGLATFGVIIVTVVLGVAFISINFQGFFLERYARRTFLE
jgi:NhaP-type Na+/H+ and K+/H+ antiporter